MVRTQVYLTEAEQKSLRSLGKKNNRSQSEMIRQAVDEFIEKHAGSHHAAVLDRVFGLWRDRTDLPDLRELRRGWSRREKRLWDKTAR